MARNPFLDHPHAVGESYLGHAGAAVHFSARLALAACACGVHAIFPWLCGSTASRIVAGLNEEMRRRQPNGQDAPNPPFVADRSRLPAMTDAGH
ncbi:MAG: DUF6356 family protein [Pseudomonadota bacterium]